MSIWTHVNGSIRVDSHVDVNRFKTFTYYSSYEDKKACNVPRGKEESLQVQVYNYPDERDTRSTINFFGDLRGFDDHKAIIDWVLSVIEELELFVYDGIITIDDSIYVYTEEYDEEIDEDPDDTEWFSMCNKRFECVRGIL